MYTVFYSVYTVRQLWDEGNGIMRIEFATSPPVNDDVQTLGITKTGDLFVAKEHL